VLSTTVAARTLIEKVFDVKHADTTFVESVDDGSLKVSISGSEKDVGTISQQLIGVRAVNRKYSYYCH